MTSTVGEIGLRFAHPGLSGLSGGLIWGAATAIAHPSIAKPGESGLTLGNWGVLVSIATIGLAIAFVTGLWGWAGSPQRLRAVAVVLAVAAAIVVVAPWSGWPNILAATALGLAVEHHHRTGVWTSMSGFAAGLAVIAFAIATVWSLFFP